MRSTTAGSLFSSDRHMKIIFSELLFLIYLLGFFYSIIYNLLSHTERVREKAEF